MNLTPRSSKELFGEDCTYKTVEALRALESITRQTWSLVSAAEKRWIP